MASTPFNIAAAAYGNASRLSVKSDIETAASSVASGPNFAQMLAQSVQGVVESRSADPMSIAMVGDAASLMLQQAAMPGAQLGTAPAQQGNDFAQILAQSVQGVVDSGRASEKMSMDMVNGKANVVDMVTALSQTEMAIESIVTIRDRVIASYEEIMRMPI
ncbi:flagellar hook-basal body complex protein FliE [Devosia sp. FJ2-5-3]|jgi:flagellar hook-basal body complex protein FliE|uniref:flagellar hook-basal body complex protein FliE n=1 Tax=Devosia sp. FJ2-5-3 TaxID=2976680 RepID=UPI0023D866CF|nr:flagellar hook-basal body complex protein FliE [Devosia sp. FJ2-5-3]WEJ59988.1 flagellar hook-basal body complex protein FliE [Devosia sp. FJ2-5-3]